MKSPAVGQWSLFINEYGGVMRSEAGIVPAGFNNPGEKYLLSKFIDHLLLKIMSP